MHSRISTLENTGTGAGQSSKQHFTVSQIVRLYVVFECKHIIYYDESISLIYSNTNIITLKIRYADFVVALNETSSSSSFDEIDKKEKEEEKVLKDHFENMTRQNTECLRHSNDLANRIHQSSSLLMQMIPLTMFAIKEKKKKQSSNYALELEHVVYVTMMRELFKSTSELLAASFEKRRNLESKVFASLRWFLSLASTRGCQIHLSKPSMLTLLFKLGLEPLKILDEDVRSLISVSLFFFHLCVLKCH